jgi:hypothetical protein
MTFDYPQNDKQKTMRDMKHLKLLQHFLWLSLENPSMYDMCSRFSNRKLIIQS